MTLEGIDFPRTHDLEYLLTLAGKHSIALDPECESGSWLTPWAVEFRYDDDPIETLDRRRAIATASAAVVWCEALVPSRAEPASEPNGEARRPRE